MGVFPIKDFGYKDTILLERNQSRLQSHVCQLDLTDVIGEPVSRRIRSHIRDDQIGCPTEECKEIFWIGIDNGLVQKVLGY